MRLRVDAIVNAANGALRPGGGVDGAINRAAGPRLAEAMAAQIGKPGGAAESGRLPDGKAVVTEGFDLPAAWVIHAVGPHWSGGDRGEAEALAGAYTESLRLAAGKELHTVAFPAISTGVYGFPKDRAAEISVAAIRRWLDDNAHPKKVLLSAFDAETARLWQAEIDRLG